MLTSLFILYIPLVLCPQTHKLTNSHIQITCSSYLVYLHLPHPSSPQITIVTINHQPSYHTTAIHPFTSTPPSLEIIWETIEVIYIPATYLGIQNMFTRLGYSICILLRCHFTSPRRFDRIRSAKINETIVLAEEKLIQIKLNDVTI